MSGLETEGMLTSRLFQKAVLAAPSLRGQDHDHVLAHVCDLTPFYMLKLVFTVNQKPWN